MKNILLLTNIYPTEDPKYPGTKICHFFTKEWQKAGYNVRVVHYESCFPSIYYKVGGLLKDKIMARTGSLVDMTIPREPTSYEVDGIRVLRVPLKKFVPHGSVPKRSVGKGYRATVNFLQEEGFVPDVITAHFFFPQAEFLHKLKQQYPNARTCMVMHSNGESIPHYYKKGYEELMNSIDVWGFRSKSFKKQFEAMYGKKKQEFLCYSGIPANYIQPMQKVFSNGVHRFVFLGSLYKLKNVNVTLQALSKVYQNEDYTFDVIGDGAELDNLKTEVKELHQEKNVTFHGRQPRDKAQDIMADADCFVMVSTREAYGLVYLEAMAKGLIPVATTGQGFDGIIVNGENGFLCDAENVDALAAVLEQIKSMPEEELKRISRNAFETAKELTDEKAAEKYIKSIIIDLQNDSPII